MDVVNQSAAQGIAFFSDLLGIKIPKAPAKGKKTTTTEAPADAEEEEEPAETENADAEAEETSSETESRKFSHVKSRLGRKHANSLF